MYEIPSVRPMITQQAPRTEHALRGRIHDLETKFGRLQLLCQAMYETLEESGQFDRAKIEARMKAIDARDGIEDNAISDIPLRCPNCSRVSSSKNWRCLYCGLEFERPISG